MERKVQQRKLHPLQISFRKLEADFKDKHFTKQDLETLFSHFARADKEHDGFLNKKQFQEVLQLKESPFTDKLFRAFDDHNRDKISFNDFINNLAPLHQSAPPEMKLAFIKKLYGFDQDITKKDMEKVLQDDMEHSGIKIPDQTVKEVMDTIFDDVAEPDGKVPFDKLVQATKLDPSRNLSLNIRSSIGEVLKDESKVNESAHMYYEKEKEKLEKEKQRKSRRTYRLWRYCQLHPTVIFWSMLYIVINCLLFPAGLWTIKSVERDYFSWGIILAKCFRMVLYFNIPLIFLLMCREFFAWLRRSRFLFRLFPFDSYIEFHRVVGWVIALAALGHTIGHYKDFYVVSHTPVAEINLILKTPLDGERSWAHMLFGTISGVTGHIMILCLLIMYPLTFLRRKKFEAFWFSHQLYVVFILCLLIHGSGKLITTPIFYIIFAVPGVLFIAEMIYRNIRTKHKTETLEFTPLVDEVTLLRVKKLDNFKYKAGQWVYLNCRDIATFEWHPFTLTSAPHEDFLEVHIKAVGAWTTELHRRAKANPLNSPENKPSIEYSLEDGLRNSRGGFSGDLPIKNKETKRNSYYFAKDGDKDGEKDIIDDVKVKKNKDGRKLEEGHVSNSIKINVDGPFGAPAQNFGHYNTVILFAAGIGVTPFASILKHILWKIKVKEDWPVKKVYFIWSARSQKNFSWFTEIIKEAEDFNTTRPKTFDLSLYFTGAQKEDDIRSAMLTSLLNYHYSRKKQCIVTGLGTKIQFSRPPIPKLFDTIQAQHEKEEHIGVFYCGPPPLATVLAHECHEKRHSQKFKFHKENF